MAFRIFNNVQSLNALRNLNLTQSRLGKSLERLSSGLKVNTGKDGPAALVISEKLRAQIAGLSQAVDNAEQAVSLVQLVEGSLAEVNTLLTSIRSLAVHAANEGANDADSLAADQQEITILSGLLQLQREHYKQRPQEAQQLVSTGLSAAPADLDVPELAAWTAVARTLFNMHEFITRN